MNSVLLLSKMLIFVHYVVQFPHGTDMNKLYTSGPLLGPSNNLDKILQERDRHIQEYARQTRHGKTTNSQLKGVRATTGKHHMSSYGK